MILFKNVSEKIIKIINDKLLAYGDYTYYYIGNVISREKRNVIGRIKNENINLIRINAHEFKDNNDRLFIIEGNSIFLKNEHPDKNINNLKPIIVDINNNPSKITNNSLTCGDNLIALNLMQQTHQGKIDLISIDPPYNTRNKDMRYNDFFPIIDENDKHSAWLSFMNNRLALAKELLSNDGLIFINIDEYEYPYLKILCDHIFGEKNLIETFIWEKNSTKNNSKTTSNNHEYIICYAKNKKNIETLKYFRKRKEGIDEVYHIINKYKNKEYSKTLQNQAQKEIRTFFSENNHLKGIKQYKFVDEHFNVYRISDVSAPAGGGLGFELLHPITGKPCKQPAGGFRYNESKIKEHLKNNRFHFGKDEKTVPQYKRYLHEVETDVWKSVIKNTDEGAKDLEKIFGYAPFNNAKPISLLKDIISMINKKKIICLDFFAGSCSLGHAVVDYNRENKTEHSFILITNNESNIFFDVSIPRMKSRINNININKIIHR